MTGLDSPRSILINLSLDHNSLRTQSFNLVWFGLLNLKISGLFVVVRGLEPLREEPKSPMLTITSHNNRFYDTSSHDEAPQQLCMFYDKMLNNIVAMAGFEPATCGLCINQNVSDTTNLTSPPL